MRLLLDSHTLIWAVEDPTKLGPQALAGLQDAGNTVVVSAATVWELSIKCGLGKLTLSLPFRRWIEQALADLEAELLPISIASADLQAALPLHHRDPFDRMLIAQSRVEGIPLLSNDAMFDNYQVNRVW